MAFCSGLSSVNSGQIAVPMAARQRGPLALPGNLNQPALALSQRAGAKQGATMSHRVGACSATLRPHRCRPSVAALCGVLLVALAALPANAQLRAPSGLVAEAGNAEVRLRWENPQNPAIARYEFRFGAGAMPAFNGWAEVPESGAQTVAHTVRGLINGTRYVFEVRAAAEDGTGPEARAATTLAAAPEAAVAIPDANLRADIRETLALAADADITQGHLAKLTQVFSFRGGVADLAGLEYAVNLEQLGLSDNEISDVSALSGLGSLSVLDLQRNHISNISPLVELDSLYALYLSGNDITDLSALSGLRSLATLHLADNGITHIAPLEGIASLAELILADNDIADISPLAELASLGELDLAGNRIEDISALARLTALQSLSLSGNAVADVSALAGLRSLDALYLAGNAIEDLTALNGLAALVVLHLADNELSDISALAPLASLWVLDLSANAISDIAALAELSALVDVNLADNAVSDISALSELASLSTLNLGGNEVADVSAFANHQALASLDLSSNAIVDVSGLTGLPALVALYLSGNEIADATALAGLTGLRTLHLAANELTEAPDLSAIGLLRVLQLSGNMLSDISALSGLESLRTLRLDGNAIVDVSALGGLALASLDLRDNAVADISPLAEIAFPGSGSYVDVRGNPLQDEGEHVRALRERRVVVVLDDGGHRVPLFPTASSAGNPSPQGFVRVINHSDEAGSIGIEAVDETGERRGPVTLAIEAGEALHFNAEELEQGNSGKGLRGIGEGTGDWRLTVRSALDVEVLAYARTPDGFVTSLHEVAAQAYDTSAVPIFNPGSNRRQLSRLRVINPTGEAASVAVSATDDKGDLRDGVIEVAAGQTLDLPAARLESGESIAHFAGLGNGAGKWRLAVSAPGQRVMSLLQSPTGHLTNLSTGTAVSSRDVRTYHAERDGGRYRVPLFLADANDIQGFLRLVNVSYARASVVLRAFDSAGVEHEATTFTLRGGEATHLNSRHFEQGDPARGLVGVGTGTGDWHLEVSADRRFEALAYARTADGFVTSLHDTAPRASDGSLWIPFFNPGSNRRQASQLRLVNWGDAVAEATITGVDDAGSSAAEAVRATIPARSARDYMAWQLETGDGPGLSGALGDGSGKWRLRVATTGDVQAMSLLRLPTGHLANLSTTPRHLSR